MGIASSEVSGTGMWCLLYMQQDLGREHKIV